MAISYNTGKTAIATNVAHTSQPTLTVPVGVLVNDLMLVSISIFTFTPTTPDFTLTATSGHTWTVQGGGVIVTAANGGLNSLSKIWSRVATSGDAGDTLTFAFTGTPGSPDQFWWDICLDAWTGAGAVDVITQANSGNTQTLGPGPTIATGVAGDWAVQICAAVVSGSGNFTGIPSGTTQRSLVNANSGVNHSVVDSNASVGGAGTTIGGGTFVTSAQALNYVQWTIGISPAGAGGPTPLPSKTSPSTIPRLRANYW